MSRRPHRDSALVRVAGHLSVNRDADLTVAAVASLCNVTEVRAAAVLRRLQVDRIVERVVVYRLRPEIKRIPA